MFRGLEALGASPWHPHPPRRSGGRRRRLQSQIRNIETTYGKPLDYWFAVIDSSGLILPATTPAVGRLESAAKFNPLFTHRVRITAASDLDDELRAWLATA